MEEWVEIVEPRTKEHMFANLTTGECLWDPPPGVPVKKTNENQWWELFDQNTSRFYYYNATSQKTVWHRPTNCDIIPLAKLQTLKQNTEVKNESSGASVRTEDSKMTQTAGAECATKSSGLLGVSNSKHRSSPTKTSVRKLVNCQTSPVESPRVVRKTRHQRNHRQNSSNIEQGFNEDEFKVPESFPSRQPAPRSSSKRRTNDGSLNPTSQRFLSREEPLSPDDRRRTTIGPAQAKYYSIPAAASAKPLNPIPPKAERSPSSTSSNPISRSVSFMSRRHQESASSSPRTQSTLDKGSPGSSSSSRDVTSPIEGYCTPMINRKLSIGMPKSPPSESSMSISQLVDTGLSTLMAGSNGTRNHQKIVPVRGQESLQGRKALPQQYSVNQRNGTAESNHHSSSMKMSPIQQYILEQAKMSGYRLGDPVDTDRDSFIESEDDFRHGDESDDFADDEDDFGTGSDAISKASSSMDGEDDRFLTEPTYNNLDPVWLQSVQGYQTPSNIKPLYQQQFNLPEPPSKDEVDAFSQEFDIKMRFNSRGGIRGESNSSTMPRPASHQPTSSSIHHQHQQQQQLQHQQQQSQHQSSYPVPYDVLHPSLQRNVHSMVDHHAHHPYPNASSTLGRGGSGAFTGTGRSQSRSTSHGGSMISVSASLHSAISCESDIEKYAQDNFNIQKKGIFRKKMTVKDILTHTRESLRKPLTCLRDKTAKKEALDLFRLVQIYMGDRRAKPGMTINSVALDILQKAFMTPALRDELFVQLCKQTTENNNSRESLRRGWELIAICLSFFPPSPTFAPALQSYIQRHRDPAFDYPDVGKWPIHVQISHYAGISAKRLDRIGEGGRLQPRKPTIEEIDQARLQIFRPSMFGGTLAEAMEIQRDRFPERKLPWILTVLADQIIRLNGLSTEGIFRVPADLDEVMNVKSRFDQWEVPMCADCHTAASLLKLWFRELYEPLIPDAYYDECIRIGAKDSDHPDNVNSLVDRLPLLNRDVLSFLIRLLQTFARQEVVNATKMDASNLSTVFAPNIVRCMSKDPAVILDNTRKEMSFVKALICHMDTSHMEGVL